MILDVNHTDQNGIVNIRFTFSPLAQRRSKQRCSMVKVHSIHIGSKNVGEAVVRRCERIERS